jgi:hypothetical protein
MTEKRAYTAWQVAQGVVAGEMMTIALVDTGNSAHGRWIVAGLGAFMLVLVLATPWLNRRWPGEAQ